MPCSDQYSYAKDDRIEEYKKQNDKLADMLCKILNKVYAEETYNIEEFGNDIFQWWEEHKKFDEERNK